MEQYVSVLVNCEIYTQSKFHLLPLSFTVHGRAETLNSAPLFVCRVSCSMQFFKGRVNCTEFRLILHLRAHKTSPSPDTSESLVRNSDHLWPHPVLSRCMGFFHKINDAFWDWHRWFLVCGCDPLIKGEKDFSLNQLSLIKRCIWKYNLGLASLTNPLPDLCSPFPSMKQWLWSQCETKTLLVLGVYYLCVKNVGSMCGQCRSLSGLCGGQKNVFFNDSFF